MRVKYAYLDEQFADFESYFPELRKLIQSGEFTLGPWVEAFEKDFSAYVGTKYAISTNTGTDALVLSFKSLGIGAGDEVITAANTFYATVGAIVTAGARPVLVDCDDRYVLDVNKIEKAITKKTKAIVPVHWVGHPVDMKTVLTIAEKHGLSVVEDACPSAGARINNQHVGSFGNLGAFSFHPLKPLNVWGDGGCIVTSDDKLAKWLRSYRNHGMVDRNHIEMWGVNARMQPIQAMVARKLLPQIEDLTARRIAHAKQLDNGLKNLSDFIHLPPRPTNMREVYQLYMMCVKNRDELLKYLISKEIEAKVHYPVPLHLQKAAEGLGYRKGDFPVAEKQANELITLPAHQHITSEQVDYMISEIKAFYKS